MTLATSSGDRLAAAWKGSRSSGSWSEPLSTVNSVWWTSARSWRPSAGAEDFDLPGDGPVPVRISLVGRPREEASWKDALPPRGSRGSGRPHPWPVTGLSRNSSRCRLACVPRAAVTWRLSAPCVRRRLLDARSSPFAPTGRCDGRRYPRRGPGRQSLTVFSAPRQKGRTMPDGRRRIRDPKRKQKILESAVELIGIGRAHV